MLQSLTGASIDGVLLRGKKALPKAKETLEYLDSQLIPFVLLTNGGGMTEERRARVLSRELGFPLDAGLIVQSHTPFEVMDEHKKGCALVVGGEKDLTAVVADKYVEVSRTSGITVSCLRREQDMAIRTSSLPATSSGRTLRFGPFLSH